jgi:hypothetical protein
MGHSAHKYWRDVLNRMNPMYHSGILISILNEGRAYIYIYTLMHATYVNMCMPRCLCVCLCAYVYACVLMYMRVCLCICVCADVNV